MPSSESVTQTYLNMEKMAPIVKKMEEDAQKMNYNYTMTLQQFHQTFISKLKLSHDRSLYLFSFIKKSTAGNYYQIFVRLSMLGAKELITQNINKRGEIELNNFNLMIYGNRLINELSLMPIEVKLSVLQNHFKKELVNQIMRQYLITQKLAPRIVIDFTKFFSKHIKLIIYNLPQDGSLVCKIAFKDTQLSQVPYEVQRELYLFDQLENDLRNKQDTEQPLS